MTSHFLDLLRQRKSIRQFLNKPIEKEVINRLQESLLLSPSSRSLDPWRFIFIEDSAMLCKLSESKTHGSQFLKEAPLGVVVLGDPNTSDTWVEDTSIASIILQFTAQSLGLGSCWIQIRNRFNSENLSSSTYVKNQLSLELDFEVESIIALGYPKTETERPSPPLDWGKILPFTP